MIGVLGAFLLVLALLLLFLRLIGRIGKGRAKAGRVFTLRGTMALDSRRYLAAVEIDGQLLVVGVTPDRLTALGQWPLVLEDEPFQDLPPEPTKFIQPPEKPRKVAPAKSAPPKNAAPKNALAPLAPSKAELNAVAVNATNVSAPIEELFEERLAAGPVLVKPETGARPAVGARNLTPTPPAAPDLGFEPRPSEPKVARPAIDPESSISLVDLLDPPEPRIVSPAKAIKSARVEEIELDLLEPGLDIADPGHDDEEPDALDFSLTLDDEPFMGSETNDDFLGVVDLDPPPRRR
jgi:flagellar biogenesis protein FliO